MSGARNFGGSCFTMTVTPKITVMTLTLWCRSRRSTRYSTIHLGTLCHIVLDACITNHLASFLRCVIALYYHDDECVRFAMDEVDTVYSINFIHSRSSRNGPCVRKLRFTSRLLWTLSTTGKESQAALRAEPGPRTRRSGKAAASAAGRVHYTWLYFRALIPPTL